MPAAVRQTACQAAFSTPGNRLQSSGSDMYSVPDTYMHKQPLANSLDHTLACPQHILCGLPEHLECLHAPCPRFYCHGFAILACGTAVQVSFVSLPEYLDFDTDFLGGTKLESLMPSLKAWLMGFLQDSLLSMYVLPEHWLYQIDMVSAINSCLAARILG